VPDRVTQNLLGEDRVAPELRRWVSAARWPADAVDTIAAASDGRRLIYVRGEAHHLADPLTGADGNGWPVILADMSLMSADEPEEASVKALIREAALSGSILIATNTDRSLTVLTT
jgi:hypothetical protein